MDCRRSGEIGAIADLIIADAMRDRLEHAAPTIRVIGKSYRGVEARKCDDCDGRAAIRTIELRYSTSIASIRSAAQSPGSR